MTDQIEPRDPSPESPESPPAMTDQIAPQDAPAAVPPPPPVRRVGRRGPVAIAPALSVVGLLIAGLLTFQVYRNWTPTLSSSAVDTPTATPVPVESGQTPTPAPTATIKTNPEISVPGTLVYVENGSLWVQSGTKASQLTQPVNGSKASQPAFSPDGQWIERFRLLRNNHRDDSYIL